MTKQNYVYGIHAIESLLQHQKDRIRKLLLQKSRHDVRVKKIIDMASRADIPVEFVERAESLVGDVKHQGIVAEINEQKTLTEKDLIKMITSLKEDPFLLILDGVQDPHNLGACLRSANAAGVYAVIAPKDNSVGLTPIVHKVASGAAEVTPFIQVANLARTMQELQSHGIWLIGATDEATETLFESDLKGPIALVLGAEGGGLRRLTKERCDRLVSIPMKGSVSSLNVSVATGVVLFEAVRQRSYNKN